MSPLTPPNACGASPDPSRLAQQSLRLFWSWTPLAPFLGLKSPWLEIWGPQLRAFGALSQGSAPVQVFAGPWAPPTKPQAEAAPKAEAAPEAKAPAKAKAKAPAKVEAAPAPKAEAAAPAAKAAEEAPAEEAPAEDKPAKAPAKAKAAAPKAPAPAPAADKDLFADQEPAAAEPSLEAAAEPSLEAVFTAPAAQAEPAPAPAPEAAPAPVQEAAPAASLAQDDLTRVEGVGPATARRLVEQGVVRYADLAALTPEALIEIRRVGSLTITADQAREIIASAAELARPH